MATSSDSIDDSTDQIHVNEDNGNFKAEEKEYFCTPCQLDGQKLPVEGFCVNCDEYLCEICYKYHLRPLVTRNHILLDKTHMPHKDIDASRADVIDEICEKHAGKIVEFYCTECDKVGCKICVTINHRTCKVVFIPEHTQENNPEYFSISTITVAIDEIKKKVMEYKWIAALHSQNSHKQVKKYRKELNDMLDNLENNMHKKIDITDEVCTELESCSKRLELTKKKLIKYEVNSGINKKFVSIKLAKDTLAKYKEDKQEMLEETNRKVGFHFNPNKDILANESALGNITDITNEQENDVILKFHHSLSTDCLKKFFPEFLSECNSSIVIHKCIILSSGNLLFKARMGFYVGTILTLCKTEAKSEPYQGNANISVICVKDIMFSDMAVVGTNMVALTLSEKKKIQFVRIHGAKLELDTSIDVNGECDGIGCIDDKLFVTFPRENKVEIMDKYGHVKNTVSVSNEVAHLLQDFEFRYTSHIACDPNRKLAYISISKDCIFVVNINGEITTMIPNNPDFYQTWMCGPMALAVGQDGAIYVAVNNPYSIQRISPNYLKRNILVWKGTTWDICSLAYHESRLYSGNRSGGFHIYELI